MAAFNPSNRPSNLAARCWRWQIQMRALRSGDDPGALEEDAAVAAVRGDGGADGGVAEGVESLTVFQLRVGVEMRACA